MNNKTKILIAILLVASTLTAFIIFQNIFTDNGNNNNTTKVVILTFSDSSKSQYANARAILNGYGFKGTFFITCTLVAPSSKSPSMTWQNIATLQKEGHNIESGAITYAPLTNLSRARLDHEVQQSKQCLLNHGIESTIFRTPYGRAWDNSTIINTIAKYYKFSINGFSNLMHLRCNGWEQQYVQQQQQQQHVQQQHVQQQYVQQQYVQQQPDCRTYLQDGSLTFANRYSIREWNHNTFDIRYSHNSAKIFQAFVDEVNRQTPYNYNRNITAIPIIAYHNIDNKKQPNSTDVNLFADEMKYLHDNGFKVLTVADLTYDENKNLLSVKRIPGVSTPSQ
jgi:peptidoglycan/xylan/chitin deacetylase (PgdA/CDA1 family)